MATPNELVGALIDGLDPRWDLRVVDGPHVISDHKVVFYLSEEGNPSHRLRVEVMD
jgi:hypothetical protein